MLTRLPHLLLLALLPLAGTAQILPATLATATTDASSRAALGGLALGLYLVRAAGVSVRLAVE